MLDKLTKKNSRYGAGILFTDGKRILLLQRAEKEDHGKWSIPGGRSDPGETALETAKRETKEEAGEVHGKRFASFVYRDKHQVYTTFLFAVEDRFEPELSHEHSDAKWVKIKDAEDYDLHDKFRSELPKYISAINRYYKKDYSSFKEWLDENE